MPILLYSLMLELCSRKSSPPFASSLGGSWFYTAWFKRREWFTVVYFNFNLPPGGKTHFGNKLLFFVAALLVFFLPYKCSTEHFELYLALISADSCSFSSLKPFSWWTNTWWSGKVKYALQLCPLDIHYGSLNSSFQLVVLETNVAVAGASYFVRNKSWSSTVFKVKLLATGYFEALRSSTSLNENKKWLPSSTQWYFR